MNIFHKPTPVYRYKCEICGKEFDALRWKFALILCKKCRNNYDSRIRHERKAVTND